MNVAVLATRILQACSATTYLGLADQQLWRRFIAS